MTTAVTPTGEVTSDYETFHSWLVRNGWFCQWQNKAPKETTIKYYALYMARQTGTMILTVEYKDKKDGWNYFIATDKHEISDCLNELTALATKKAEAA